MVFFQEEEPLLLLLQLERELELLLDAAEWLEKVVIAGEQSLASWMKIDA